jgi:tetratricopeptide (TPR) repeat protein
MSHGMCDVYSERSMKLHPNSTGAGLGAQIATILAVVLSGCGNRDPLPPDTTLPGTDANRRGLSLLAAGDLEGAEAQFREAILAAGSVDDLVTRAEALYNLGVSLRELERSTEASEVLRDSERLFDRLRADAGRARAIAARATLLIDAGRLDAGRVELERARDVAPEAVLPEIETELASALWRLGDRERALETIERAISSATNDLVLADALFRWGEILFESQRFAEARQAFERALDYDRRSGRRRHIAADLERLAEIATAEGTHDAAADYSERAAAVLESLESEQSTAPAATSTTNPAANAEDPPRG